MTRAAIKARRQRAFHEDRIGRAQTPKERLWRVCGWLVAEAWRAGRLDDATDAVLTKVHEIREETT